MLLAAAEAMSRLAVQEERFPAHPHFICRNETRVAPLRQSNRDGDIQRP
jgi:hypothetical protein